MKFSSPSFIIVLCVGLAAFSLGYFLGDGPRLSPAALPEMPEGPSPATLPSTAPGAADPQVGPGAGAEPVILNSEQTRVRTFELLGEPNRIVRLRELCELLAHVTAENWRGAIEAFAIQTKTEGRWQLDEWHLMIERVGEVAGAQALAEALQAGGDSDVYRARKLLTGFAAGDPKTALEWYRAQAPEQQKRLFSDLIAGLGRSDPKMAMSLILDQPREVWEPDASSIINGALQSGGFRAADELFSSIRNRPEVPEQLKSKVLYDLVKWQVTIGADPARLLDWVEPHLAMAGPNTVKESVTLAAKADPAWTLDWLEARADRMVPAQGSSAYAIVAGIMQAQAPEQFVAWMNAHPDHPQHDRMAQAAIDVLLRNGQVDEAVKWKEKIRDPQMRESLDRAILGKPQPK